MHGGECLPGRDRDPRQTSFGCTSPLPARTSHPLAECDKFHCAHGERNRDNSRASAVLLGRDRWTRSAISARFTAALSSGRTFGMGTVPAFSSGLALRADGITLCNFGTPFATFLEEPCASEGTAFLELTFW